MRFVRGAESGDKLSATGVAAAATRGIVPQRTLGVGEGLITQAIH
jgi:hypothetical protein